MDALTGGADLKERVGFREKQEAIDEKWSQDLKRATCKKLMLIVFHRLETLISYMRAMHVN